MSAQVILKSIRGGPRAEVMVFTQKACHLIGRSSTCSLRVSEVDLAVSRYHCLLDIAPPMVEVEDLGSRNGTYVNGQCIGRREPGHVAGEDLLRKAKRHVLSNGDVLQLGGITFEVIIDEMPLAESDPEAMTEHCGAVS